MKNPNFAGSLDMEWPRHICSSTMRMPLQWKT